MLIYTTGDILAKNPHTMLKHNSRLLHRLTIPCNVYKISPYFGNNCGWRWHLTDASKEKPLFSLDVDLSQFDEKSPTNFRDLKSNDNLNNELSPDSDSKAFTNQILADFVLDSKSLEPTPLDQILGKMSKEDNSDLDLLRSESLKRSEIESSNERDVESESAQSIEDPIQKEKSLFDEIFAKYSTENTEKQKEHWKFDLTDQVLSTLQESFSNAKTSSISGFVTEEQEVEKMTASALNETTEHISALNSSRELMQFSYNLFQRYKNEDYDKNSFYIKKQRNESSFEFLDRQNLLRQAVEEKSIQDPENPLLTSETMPIIFNSVLETLISKHYDAASALTLFNLAKEDLALYTVLCNQSTYNKMLKVYWIFYGKASLYEVELQVVEMMNNGFKGDIETFAILKEILMSYHTIRMGKTIYNPGGLPLWSREDEKRAVNLGMKLLKIGKLFLSS